MVLMVLLFIILVCLFLLRYRLSYRNNPTSPEICFVVGFLISVGYSFHWINEWDLELSETTFYILVGGISLFVITSLTFQRIFTHVRLTFKKRDNYCIYNKRKKNSFRSALSNVDSWKLILFLIIQLLILTLSVYYMLHRINGDIASAIYAINSSSKTEEERIAFPFLIRHLRYLSFSSSFIWIYLLIHSKVFKYKSNDFLLVINAGLSVLIYLLGGARQGLIQVVMGGFVIAYFLKNKKNGKTNRIKTKRLLQIVIASLLFVILFQSLGDIIGRNSRIESNDYIAAYISAEIKNLDTFVREGRFGQGNSFEKTQTFAHLSNQLSGHFGFPERPFKFDQRYRYINGHFLGNVYTVFWAFLYDGSYKALILLTVLMAIILQWCYIRAVKCCDAENYISMPIIVYSYMYFESAFSFFSYWFYARTFSFSFIYYLCYWWLLKFFIERVNLNGKRV